MAVKKKTKKTKKANHKRIESQAKKGFEIDRRRHFRRSVLDTFHVFLCVQQHGLAKFYLRDISESGFAFEVERLEDFVKNKTYDCRFFINSGLSLELKFRVAHVQPNADSETVKIGAELVGLESATKKAYGLFVKLLDELGKISNIYAAKPL
jgi:hypothetical protein